MCRSDRSEHFPVVYTTDADDFFGGLAAQAMMLQTLGETPRFILVGIGYENSRASTLLRMRDLWTHNHRALYCTEMRHLLQSQLVSGVDDLNTITGTTDATEFLQFIREELMPFMSNRYPVLPGECSFSGYSGGGGFGLYTLFTRPETFKHYILGSPGTSYRGYNYAVKMAERFKESSQTIAAKVFMSVGELEEFKKGFWQFDLVSGYFQLAKFLQQAAIPGLDVTLKIFPGETHATAWTLAFSHGVKTLLGSVDDVPYWPEYLK